MQDLLFLEINHRVQYFTENALSVLLIDGVVLVVFQIIEQIDTNTRPLEDKDIVLVEVMMFNEFYDVRMVEVLLEEDL